MALEIRLPSSSRRLSAAEVTRARQVGQRIAALLRDRDDYVARHDVPRAFAYPGANWEEDGPANDFVSAYRLILEGSDHTLQNLRHHVQVFSGNHLLSMRVEQGEKSVTPLPQNADSIAIESIRQRGQIYIDRWRSFTAALPSTSWIHAPLMFGEIGVEADGPIINCDTCGYQERVKLLHDAGVFRRLDQRLEQTGHLQFLEIGGGYGALAHLLKGKYPASSYTIVDLPQSMICSAIYTALARPDVAHSVGSVKDYAFNFIPNYAALQVVRSFDLVINTISFSEMPEPIVRQYGAMMTGHWLRNGGLLFEQNQDHRSIGFSCAQDIFQSMLPHRHAMTSDAPLYQGMPNLWSLDAFPKPGSRAPF